MTDRELLEAAAKAAGLSIYFDDIGQCCKRIPGDIATTWLWEPLEDDGDALRLACDLGLRIFPIARTETGAACSAIGSVTGERISEVRDSSIDTRTATRRAIVRAAAAIGSKA